MSRGKIKFLLSLSFICLSISLTAQAANLPTISDNVYITKQDKVFVYNLATKKLKQVTPDDYAVIGYTGAYYPSSKNVFLLKGGQVYLFDLVNSKLKKTSLPKMKEDAKSYESVGRIMLSRDKSQILIAIALYDNATVPSEMDGSIQPTSTRYVEYNLLTDKWTNSSLIADAYKTIGQDANNYYLGPVFVKWDSQTSRLFGLTAKWDGPNSSPVYAVDMKTKKFITVDSYGNIETSYFSPSLKKVILMDSDVVPYTLSLYNFINPKKAEKSIDLTSIFDKHCDYTKSLYKYEVSCGEGLDSLAWSPDESQVTFGLEYQIYTINLKTGKIALNFSDKTGGNSNMYWDRNYLTYSASGRYVYFVDNDKGKNVRLMSIDTKTNRLSVLTTLTEPFEILSGGY